MNINLLDSINKIGKYCQSEKLTLSVAESVTSGYLQFLFSQGENTTSYFQGGITLYNNTQKFEQFGISPSLTSDNYGVSLKVTELLALGANSHFDTNLGIGITGFAYQHVKYGINPHCYIAIAFKNKIIHTDKVDKDLGSMNLNQQYFASQCINQLYSNLQKLKTSVL